ncbi:MAG: hypothetical protein WA822_01215 [Albidovulum sp.]
MAVDTVRLCADIETLIHSERLAIRQGNLTELGALAARKAHLIGQIAPTGDRAMAARLLVLKQRAEANQTLLSAAIDGVKAARARLSAIRGVAFRLDTYDSNGRAQSVAFEAGSVERRA